MPKSGRRAEALVDALGREDGAGMGPPAALPLCSATVSQAWSHWREEVPAQKLPSTQGQQPWRKEQGPGQQRPSRDDVTGPKTAPRPRAQACARVCPRKAGFLSMASPALAMCPAGLLPAALTARVTQGPTAAWQSAGCPCGSQPR